MLSLNFSVMNLVVNLVVDLNAELRYVLLDVREYQRLDRNDVLNVWDWLNFEFAGDYECHSLYEDLLDLVLDNLSLDLHLDDDFLWSVLDDLV